MPKRKKTRLEKEIQIVRVSVINIKRLLRAAIMSLSPNPNIYWVDGGFVVNSSLIFSKKEKILSPEYYDFKCQYKMLCRVIDNTPIDSLTEKLKEIVKTGKISLRDNMNAKFIFHPDVITEINKIINN